MTPAATSRAIAKDAAPPAPGEPGLSIVIPLFNEAASLPGLNQRVCEVLRRLRETRGLRSEIVYVDDGSHDATLAIARALPASAADVQIVALSRNFGKEAALLAGLDHARLSAVLFMDGDGQHPPGLIDTLVAHWLDDGYDVVYTAKANRENEPLLRRLGVKTFYSMINWGARQKIPVDAGDFRLLSPRAAAALRQSSLLGILLAASALIFGGIILVQTLVYEELVPGYPSLIVGLMVLGGVQLTMIGIMGEYIGKILSELKQRPVYFVAEHSVKAAQTGAGATGTAQAAAE